MKKHQNPDGTYDGVGVMSDLTGLDSTEVLALAAQVKANQDRLRACGWHEFEPIPGSALPGFLRKRYRCQHCAGEVDAHAYHWHEQGRRERP